MNKASFPKALVPLSLALSAIPACAPPMFASNGDSVSLNDLAEAIQAGACLLEADQSESFMPRVSGAYSSAIPLTVDANFTLDEREKIESAVASWNRWAKGALGHKVFKISYDALSEDHSPSSALSACRFTVPLEGRGFAILRGMDKDAWESFGLSELNPAATIRCQNSSTLLRQVMIVQADWLNETQFESVVLHELGHSLGLDHSCDATGDEDGYTGCSGLPSSHEYRSAVMYPSLKALTLVVSTDSESIVTAPEVKETLTPNDTDRASCLYLFDQEGGSFSFARKDD